MAPSETISHEAASTKIPDFNPLSESTVNRARFIYQAALACRGMLRELCLELGMNTGESRILGDVRITMPSEDAVFQHMGPVSTKAA